jgi:hypothetical protein
MESGVEFVFIIASNVAFGLLCVSAFWLGGWLYEARRNRRIREMHRAFLVAKARQAKLTPDE